MSAKRKNRMKRCLEPTKHLRCGNANVLNNKVLLKDCKQ